ncbi:MAG: tetratricopeptide repeat protein [Armatimonadetes bacterium]|nr:tetratricopeptide repeat protein [Armatimonadota bacterium]
MKKLIISLIAFLLINCILFATAEKVAVLDFEKNDRDSDYVSKQLMKSDFKAVFKDYENLELIDQKETKKVVDVLKKQGYTNLFNLGIEQITELGNQLGASIVIWGNVSSTSSANDFKLTAKILSMKSKDVVAINFNVKKQSKQRKAAIKENLIVKIEEFSGGEVEKVLGIAMQHFNSKNYPAAEESFLQVIELEKENVNALFYLGFINYINNNFEKSEEFYLKALELEPDNMGIQEHLSGTYLKQEKYEEAIAVLTQIAEADDNPVVWLKIGKIYLDIEYYEEAQEAFERAVEIDPEFAEAHCELANLFFDQDMFDEAVPYYELSSKAFPDDEEVQKKLAKCYHKTGKLDSAIKQYKDLIAEQPDNLNAFLNLAGAYRITNQDEKAIETLLELKELAPENPKVYTQLADAYVALKNYKEAENNANKAKELSPDLHEPYKILAQVFQLIGYQKYEEFLQLEEKSKDTSTYYGTKLDELIEERDKVKKTANEYFVQSGKYLDEANIRTDSVPAFKEIKSRREVLKKLLEATKSDWF